MAGTFSESWHRVASLRIALRPAVRFQKQLYRGEEWYVLQDSSTGAFFRLSPAYYAFVARLDFSRTIEDLWFESLEKDPENGPGQNDVIQLLMKLNSANLLYFKDPADSAALYERGWRKKRSETRQRWSNILFIRFPLWNPEAWLTRLLPLWKILFSRWGFGVWVLVVFLGIKVGIEHAGEISDQAVNVLAPGNLFSLYLGIACIKIFHEIGHSALCKRYGGEVNTIGVMFLIFAPLPYMDATSSWAFGQKWHRILVSSGGVLIELFLGSLACFVWAVSPPGMVHGLAYNMMFTATVSTIVFNVNPLMRFDGYYILSDLIEIPNLFQKSREQIYSFCKKYIFGLRSAVLPARSGRESGWLFSYGIASMIYRIILFTGIALFVADRYFIVGVILALSMAYLWMIMPPVKFMRYLFRSPELRLVRPRAIFSSGLIILVPLLVLLFIPFPHSYKAPGIVESKEFSNVVADTPGRVRTIVARSGDRVKSGEVLIILTNPELDFERDKINSQIEQMKIIQQQALRSRNVDRAPIEKRREALLQAMFHLELRSEALTIRARHDGTWSFPDAGAILGQWIVRGHDLGSLIDETAFQFSAVIGQEDATDIFESEISGLDIRLRGQSENVIPVVHHQLLPHAHEKLPSAALGWSGGGTVRVDQSDGSGTKASELFYILHADFSAVPELTIKHGQTGILRIGMPPQPLALRGVRYLRQFFQKRYSL